MKMGKIVWAVNPFENDPKLLKKSVTMLKTLSRRSGLRVEPVYVVSPAEANVALEFSIPSKDRYRAVALAELKLFLEKIPLSKLLPPTVLVENHVRLSASARTLARYARTTGASVIVIATQARSGIGRALLGSFAETLLLHAKTPVMLVNPQLRPRAVLRNILFATDLSPSSRRVFARFCRFAAKLRAKILLYHLIPKPFPWAVAATRYLLGAQAVSEEKYLQALRKNRERVARGFVRIAKNNRAAAAVAIEASGQDVSASILAEAKRKKCDGVALAAQTGRWETTLLGSTSRGVLREARIPVWVLRAP